MKSKKLEDMSSKKILKYTKHLLNLHVVEKCPESSEWERATSLRNGVEYKLYKWRKFSTISPFKNILHKNSILQAMPYDTENGGKCKCCFFLSKTCPVDVFGDLCCESLERHRGYSGMHYTFKVVEV